MRRPWPILWLWMAQVLALAVPVLLLVAWTVNERRDEFMAEAQLKARIFAEGYARELELLVGDGGDVLEALVLLPALQPMFEEGCPGGEARDLPHSLRRYGNLLLVDPEGRVVCAAIPGANPEQSFGDREWFQDTVAGDGLHVSAPIVGRLTGRPIVVLSLPIRYEEGQPPRVLALTLDLLTLSESLRRESLPERTVVSIIDREQRIVARSLGAEDWLGTRVTLPDHPDELARRETVEDHIGPDGVRRLYAAALMSGVDWTIFVGLPVDGVLASMQPYLVRATLLAATTAGVMFLLAAWSSVSVGNPVRRLAAAVRRIREEGGRLGDSLNGPREIEEVALEFDRLLESHDASLREAERGERRYRATFEQAPVGIVHQDEAGRLVQVNRRFAEMLGRTVEQLLGEHDHAFVHPEDRAASGSVYRRLYAGTLALGQVRKRYLRQDGTVIWTDSVVSRVGGKGEKPLFISVVEDITGAREAEERRALAATVFENSAEGIVISDPTRKMLAFNRAFSEITGFGDDTALGKPVSILRSERHDEAFYEALWQGVRDDGHWRGEVWIPRKDGGELPTLLSVSAVLDEAGRVTRYVFVFADLSREKEREAELDYLVHHDPLTHLPNRRLLNARLEHTIQQAFRDPGRHFSLLFIDLDDFKVVNDSLGHDAGDQLLVEFARRLESAVRTEDTVARMGGDEFMVLLEGAGTFNEISAPIGKVLEAASAPFSLSGRDVFVSASIGVAIFPLDAEDAAMLVRNADVAMYRAKEKGKNRFEFYEASMSDQAMDRLSLANDLRRALEDGQLYLVYQPKVSAEDGRVLGFEALLRWRHPERGEVGADRFIRIAEETGIIVPIGHWVLNEAARQMAEWRARGLDGVSLAINLSAHEISHPGLLQRIRAALAASGLPGEALEIELTESALIRDPQRVAPLLRDVRRLGIRIAIDDFGTGYSSLNYLRQFRLDSLKIDRSFIGELEHSAQARVIPQAVVALGRALRLSTVAEGVENELQAGILREMGCEQLQGYGIGRPLGAAETTAMLVARGLLDEEVPDQSEG